MTQNIDPVYFLEPVIIILFSAGLVVYWHYRRSFRWALLGYSLLAYAGAIAVKVVLQALTFSTFQAWFGNNPPGLGVYFGAQTVFFEVGGAFLVAAWAVSRGKLDAKDAEGYGLGLALWENAGYVGVFGLVNFIVVYIMLASGGPNSQQLLSSLVRARPELFYAPLEALPLVGYSILERVSSLFFHFSWGYLCLLAACFHKKSCFLLALPMGLVDFFVPFASTLTIPVFEWGIFILGSGALGVALLVAKSLRLDHV
jgi:hypothetical protein